MIVAMFIAMAQVAASGPTPPQSARNLASYLSNDDYPVEAMHRGAEGRVRFMLTVDEAGAVADCTITTSSGDASLDETTCRLLRERARFRPALDAIGRPTRDSFAGTINWRLNTRTSMLPIGEFIAHTELQADRAGALRCKVTIFGNVVDMGDGDSCGHLAGSDAGAALRRLRREATLTFVLEVLRPEMANSPPPPGRLVEEHEAEFDIDPQGNMVGCRFTISRTVRPLEGLGATLDLCSYRPPTDNLRFPTMPGQAGLSRRRIHSMLSLQTERSAPLR